MRDSVDDHVAAWRREFPELDPVKEEILVRVARIERHVSASRSEVMAEGDAVLWQYKTLLMLRRQGAPYQLSPSRLADILGLTRGAVSARLSSLEDRGLVRRTHDVHDRRRVTVELTNEGHRAVEAMLGEEERREQAVLSVLTPAERERLAGLLRKVLVGIESEQG